MFFLNYFLIEGQLLYSIVLVSTKHQHESAIGLLGLLPYFHFLLMYNFIHLKT